MSSVTPEEAHRYLERWTLVAQRDVAELRRTSIQTKAQQLGALMSARDVFGPEADRDGGVRQVRERWARIRQALGG